MNELLCGMIMTRSVLVIRDTDSAAVAARFMRDGKIGFAPVVDAQSHVVGVVTDRDLAMRVLAEEKPCTTPVSEAMTRKVLFVRPQDNIRAAEDMMMMHKVSRLLVLTPQRALAGIISVADIAGASGHEGETSIIVATKARKPTRKTRR